MSLKGERKQEMILGFTEFRTNKKKWKHDFFSRAVVKAPLFLIDFKFPAKHGGCHFPLISDVNPSIPIYLFRLTASKQYHFWNSVIMDRNSKSAIIGTKQPKVNQSAEQWRGR